MADSIILIGSDGHKSHHPLRWVEQALRLSKSAIGSEWEMQPPMNFPKDSEERAFTNIDYHDVMASDQRQHYALGVMTRRLVSMTMYTQDLCYLPIRLATTWMGYH